LAFVRLLLLGCLQQLLHLLLLLLLLLGASLPLLLCYCPCQQEHLLLVLHGTYCLKGHLC
jgi:hypothetical protein